jgi:hypothetical protein
MLACELIGCCLCRTVFCGRLPFRCSACRMPPNSAVLPHSTNADTRCLLLRTIADPWLSQVSEGRQRLARSAQFSCECDECSAARVRRFAAAGYLRALDENWYGRSTLFSSVHRHILPINRVCTSDIIVCSLAPSLKRKATRYIVAANLKPTRLFTSSYLCVGCGVHRVRFVVARWNGNGRLSELSGSGCALEFGEDRWCVLFCFIRCQGKKAFPVISLVYTH